MDGDMSKRRFDDCVRRIVEEDGGAVESLWFEQNGKFARVHIEWNTPDQKALIIFDLQAEDGIDVLSPLEVDTFIQNQEKADRERADRKAAD
jgi:hypothetical protein